MDVKKSTGLYLYPHPIYLDTNCSTNVLIYRFGMKYWDYG